jgi:two-component system nitrate/nitrite response regulator NarL
MASLTVREQETLELVSKGASNKIVARSLGIAESTVKVHVKHVLQKLNLRNRFEAAVWLRELREGERNA